MKQVNANPTRNRPIVLTTLAMTATGTSGTITLSGTEDVSSYKNGQSMIVIPSGGSAYGYVSGKEYFGFDFSATSFKVAATKALALTETDDVTLSGNAGDGSIYVNAQVGGVMWIGGSGDVNMRGIGDGSVFVLHKNIANGSLLPFMVKDVCVSGTTASDLVAWDD
jgi:hypothetical protein